ncbi:MAG: iron ABC transporter permease [Deltaproteobacteria bacterium]|nr:iron ABC transporter permease [Deltaproteobacteria bacterium]
MSFRGRVTRPRLAAAGLALGLGWLVGYPLLITATEAFGGGAPWTLDHFKAFAERGDEWTALGRSLWISAASVVLSALVGVPLGFFFERTEFPGRRLLGGLVALPVALPPLVGVIAFLFLYGESGFISRAVAAVLGLTGPPWRLAGAGAILLVHTYSMYVYFYLFTRAALARLDGSVLEAAANLGASPMRILFRVTLPLLRPALAGAALLTFMTSLASFSAPYIFGGNFRVMTTQIVASKLNGDLEMARVETVMLAGLALLALWGLRLLDPGDDLAATVRGVAPSRRQLTRPLAKWGAAVAGWSLSLFLLLPHFTLVLVSLVPAGTWTTEALPPVLFGGNYSTLFSRPESLKPLLNSAWMATVATLGALFLGFLAARSSLRVKGRLGRLLESLVSLPWAIPGTVFAVALATTFSIHKPQAGRFLLIGTPWILPLAYLLRNLPLTGRAAFSGLRQLDPSLEEASASLGAGPWRTMWKILLPMVRPALAAGAALAFITALGDFVTSIVLYTLDTRPISIEILASLRLQDTGLAAAYGVLLMTLSASAFVLWGRQGERV